VERFPLTAYPGSEGGTYACYAPVMSSSLITPVARGRVFVVIGQSPSKAARQGKEEKGEMFSRTFRTGRERARVWQVLPLRRKRGREGGVVPFIRCSSSEAGSTLGHVMLNSTEYNDLSVRLKRARRSSSTSSERKMRSPLTPYAVRGRVKERVLPLIPRGDQKRRR